MGKRKVKKSSTLLKIFLLNEYSTNKKDFICLDVVGQAGIEPAILSA